MPNKNEIANTVTNAVTFTLFYQNGEKETTTQTNVNDFWNDEIQFYLSGDQKEKFSFNPLLKKWESTIKY